jgi:PAS domain S-box-containing protein
MSKSEKINILMVDDQPAKLLSYEAILGELNENLIKANSAREALEHLLKHDIAIVLMDVSMPDLDGFELAEIIRQHPRYQKTAIIFVSAVRITDFDLIAGYERGAVDYVSVPVVPQILRAKVTVFAELYRKTRQLEKLNRELEYHVEQRTERLRLALEAGDMAVWELDLQSNTITLDPRCMQLFGISNDEFDGQLQTVLSKIHSEDRENVEQTLSRAIDECSAYSAEFRVVLSDGRICWLAGIGRVQNGEETGPVRVVGINYDITERKQAEEERERILSSEQALRYEAENANRLKDEFLTTLSHELRTPLTSILGWSSMLCDGKLKGDKASHALETIHRNAKSQVQLIEDLLDVSSIITGKLRLELCPVDLLSVIQSAIDSVRPAAEGKNIKLQAVFDHSPGVITGDANRLQQVIWNLLTNAIKFTPSGGRVNVDVKRVEADVEIVVSDTGQGISPDFLPFVFDRFRQADQSITRKKGGLGIGLSLVRHLVEQHGGTVQAESDGVDQGATFTVRLPIVARVIQSEPEKETIVQRQEKRESLDEVPVLSGLKVLVIDDEADTTELLKVVLEEFDTQVTTANSAAEGLAAFERINPDIIVCDLGMPQEDGYSLIKKIRALPRDLGGQTPAIALTAYAQTEDRVRALKAGFQLHLAKPVEPLELASVVALLVGRTVQV